MSQNQQNTKKTKTKRQRKLDGMSYNPKPGGTPNLHMFISRTMTEHIIPNRIKEKHLCRYPKMLYKFMDKSTAMISKVINGDLWILNFGFHDKDTDQTLYCIADKEINGQWRLRDTLCSAKDIFNATKLVNDDLPKTFRSTQSFLKKLKYYRAMELMIKDEQQRQKLFNEKIGWQNVAVFINNYDINKTSLKITKTKKVFVEGCMDASKRGNNNVRPILLFNHNSNKHNGYSIDLLWRLKMNDSDLAISFKYNTDKNAMLPSGIHLDKNKMELMCELIEPTSNVSVYFAGWISRFNVFAIGNRKDDENKLKASNKRLQQLKQQLFDTQQKLSLAEQTQIHSVNNNLNDTQYNSIQRATAMPSYIALPNVQYPTYPIQIQFAPIVQTWLFSPPQLQSISTMNNDLCVQKHTLNKEAPVFTPKADANKLRTIYE